MALLVGGEVEAAERRYDWCLAHPAPRRLLADEDRRPARSRTPAARPTCRRTSRSACWHHWLLRRDTRFVRRHAGPPSAAALDWWSRMQLPFGGIAWSQEWDDGRAGRVNDDALLAGSLEHLPVAARRRARSPSWSTTRSRSGSSPAAGCGHALREHRDLFLDKSSSRWTGTTRSSAAPCAARPAHALIDAPLGRLRGAGPRHPLRRHQPVGDRRRDLRAGAGARRRRRPRRAPCGCSPTCSTCATTTAATGPATSTPTTSSGRHEHTTYTAAAVILAADALSGTHAGRRTSCAAPRWCRTSRSSALECGCAVSRPASPASPRRTPSAPASSRARRSRLEAAARQRPLEDVVRRLAAVGGVGEHVVDRPARRRSRASGAQPV